jgi:hypothetical protein
VELWNLETWNLETGNCYHNNVNTIGSMPFGFLREYNDGKSTDKATALEWVILKGNVK